MHMYILIKTDTYFELIVLLVPVEKMPSVNPPCVLSEGNYIYGTFYSSGTQLKVADNMALVLEAPQTAGNTQHPFL